MLKVSGFDSLLVQDVVVMEISLTPLVIIVLVIQYTNAKKQNDNFDKGNSHLIPVEVLLEH